MHNKEVGKTHSEPPKDAHNVLALKLRLNEIKKQASSYANLHPNDATLSALLDMSINTEKKVQAEVIKIDEAMAKIKKDIKDPKIKVRYDFLDYQKWFMQEHATRSRSEAIRRRKYIASLTTKEKQEREMQKCAADIEYWFDNYAWILDPRNRVLFAFPFVLFEFQRESLHWLHSLIYVEGQDALIDKSRDMGVTWLIVCMYVYYWLFPNEGTKFEALVTSYREDEVDKRGVSSTIFEKMRSQIRSLPSWMLPKGFSPKEHMTHMTILNPENGSSITGTTANGETGRSGRFTAIFFDEFASIQEDVASATAASASTNTRIFVSTPKGKLNYFAELRFNGSVPVKSFHWTKHPLKDKRWYAGQKLKMSKEMVAQELDIDYDASQPGKVYPQYDEVYHVITKSDFMREVIGAVGLEEDGVTPRFKIPQDWWLGRAHDWGSSDSNGEHANMTYWFARAKEGTRSKTYGIDLSGAVFVYRELTMPPHSTVRQVARMVHDLQAPDKEQPRMQTELMSHEALSERDTYEQEHNLYYKAWDTDVNAGIAQVRDYLEIQFQHQPHPFRLPTKTDKDEKKVLKGRPMLYLIVDDDQGQFYFDEHTNKFQIRPGTDNRGLYRLRAEIGVYHYPKSEAGKPVRRQRPEKMFDDAMDCLRCMAITFPPVAQYTLAEKVEMAMPRGLRITDALKETPEEMARIWMARQHFLTEQKIAQQLANQGLRYSRRDQLLQKAKQNTLRSRGR